MGLDSVELVMTIEDKFGIEIPNNECEQIHKVQEFADSVFEKIKISPNEKCLSQIIFYRIRKALEQFGNERQIITPNSIISEFFNRINLDNDWKKFEKKIELKLPKLVDFDKNLNKEVKFLGFKIFDRTEPIAENTIRKLTDWIISINHEELIKIENISSKYEVERIICGIIEDRIGVPISEIELHHSITNDLGVD